MRKETKKITIESQAIEVTNQQQVEQLKLANLILREKLSHTKILGEVFMHYITEMGSAIIFNEEDLGQLNITYLESVRNINQQQ